MKNEREGYLGMENIATYFIKTPSLIPSEIP